MKFEPIVVKSRVKREWPPEVVLLFWAHLCGQATTAKAMREAERNTKRAAIVYAKSLGYAKPKGDPR